MPEPQLSHSLPVGVSRPAFCVALVHFLVEMMVATQGRITAEQAGIMAHGLAAIAGHSMQNYVTPPLEEDEMKRAADYVSAQFEIYTQMVDKMGRQGGQAGVQDA